MSTTGAEQENNERKTTSPPPPGEREKKSAKKNVNNRSKQKKRKRRGCRWRALLGFGCPSPLVPIGLALTFSSLSTQPVDSPSPTSPKCSLTGAPTAQPAGRKGFWRQNDKTRESSRSSVDCEGLYRLVATAHPFTPCTQNRSHPFHRLIDPDTGGHAARKRTAVYRVKDPCLSRAAGYQLETRSALGDHAAASRALLLCPALRYSHEKKPLPFFRSSLFRASSLSSFIRSYRRVHTDKGGANQIKSVLRFIRLKEQMSVSLNEPAADARFSPTRAASDERGDA